jgi:hypothetical protein
MTLIDLLFVLAPLLVVPLGLRLIRFDDRLAAQLLRLTIVVQPLGALAVLIAFLLPVGALSAGLAGVWLVVCALGALAALMQLLHARSLWPAQLAPIAALGYMAFGAGWLVLSRAGIRPLGLGSSIVELTAVHFHFTGFAALVLSWLVIRRTAPWPRWRAAANAAAGLLIIGSPVLAAGWGTPVHALQVVGAVLVASGVIGIATIAFLKVAPELRPAPRLLLRLSSLSPLLPMVLAVDYSAGHIFGFPALDIQGMAELHGTLNAIGFSLLGMLAWTFERRWLD